MRTPSSDWVVALLDSLITYSFLFAANEIPLGRTGPHAPWTHWITQPWVYVLCAPVVLVATWRGVHEFQLARRGGARWLRLPAEGAAIGAGVMLALGLFVPSTMADLVETTLEGALVMAALGALLTLVNLVLVCALPLGVTPPRGRSRPAS